MTQKEKRKEGLIDIIASQSREIEELKASKENLIKIAETFQKSAAETSKEFFSLKQEITDLKAEIERLKGDADSLAREAFDAARKQLKHPDWDYIYDDFDDWKNNQPKE